MGVVRNVGRSVGLNGRWCANLGKREVWGLGT